MIIETDVKCITRYIRTFCKIVKIFFEFDLFIRNFDEKNRKREKLEGKMELQNIGARFFFARYLTNRPQMVLVSIKESRLRPHSARVACSSE